MDQIGVPFHLDQSPEIGQSSMSVLTRDQLELAYKRVEDILAKTKPTVSDVGDIAEAYESILAHYLARYLDKRRSQ